MSSTGKNVQKRSAKLDPNAEVSTNTFPGDEHLRGRSRAEKFKHPKPTFSQPPDSADTGNRLTPDYGPIPTKEGAIKFAHGHDINGA
jgi:hypothetical protein